MHYTQKAKTALVRRLSLVCHLASGNRGNRKSRLDSLYVYCFRSLFSLFNRESDVVSDLEVIELNAYARARVKENILRSSFWRDETETSLHDLGNYSFHWF